MNAKTTIRKLLFVAFWVCVGAGMLTLLLAGISKKNRGECSGYTIRFKGNARQFFTDKNDVEKLLLKALGGRIQGQPLSAFNLHAMEQMLEDDTWIDAAELYFDNQDVLHVQVTERSPVARVFTTSGHSFYIDSLGRTMPLSDKMTAKVPVFTGFPGSKKLTAADSVQLETVRQTANYIQREPFWQSQVAQLDLRPDGNMEMVPVVGNHLVRLGNGEQVAAKFRRLLLFYKQVLSKTGFDTYPVIDVQYAGQVVASRSESGSKVDALQLKRNVDKMLNQFMQSEKDTVIKALPALYKLEADSIEAADPSLKDPETIHPEKQPNPTPRLEKPTPSVPEGNGGGQAVKPVSKPVEKKKTPSPAKKESKAQPAAPKPKAVMPKKPEEEENRGYN